MTSKLTIYVDDSIRQKLNEAAIDRSISDIVNDALESYLVSSMIGDLFPFMEGQEALSDELPSISEVKRRRPKVKGSSSEILASQRRGRNDRISR